MAFGKRSASDLPPARIPAALDGPSADSLMSAPSGVEALGAVRTRVTNPGGIDLKFIALAAGVVVLAAGAALALPSLGSVFTGGVRPIADVIANLDRPAARAALAAEAFPDADGRAFMTSLSATFPREHGKLLDTLTDVAMNGGDRDALYASLNTWSFTFVPSQMSAIGRTGARGFDAGVAVLDDVLVVMEKEIGCTGANFQQAYVKLSDPDFLKRLTRFDGPAYHTAMRANRAFVDLAAAGRSMPAASTTLTANDYNVVQSSFISMMSDPQVMSIMRAATSAQISGGAGGFDMQSRAMNDVNFCQLGRTILLKLKGMPEATKGRLFGNVMSQDLMRKYGPNSVSGPNGSSPFGILQGY